ncbi:phosphoribosylformylglycinamidine cyclo-ligase [Chloroflexota bacterium]
MTSKRRKGLVKQAYAVAGVDIDAAVSVGELIKKHARSTFRPEVLTDIGLFGGFFQLSGYRDPVLVSSADGVGTKIKLAIALGKHDTIGLDLVNHCVNDILTSGAEPLFFLDYIAMGKLIPKQVENLVSGLAHACRAVGCALIGGETAEMPGFYSGGDYDLIGFIVGAVEKNSIIDGKSITSGDVILGLPSSGLHTNGYSLIRKIFNMELSALEVYYTELGATLGEVLLEPHRCYYPRLKSVLPHIKGIAHITGGGIVDNLPRILPKGLVANIEARSWDIPPIFTLIQQQGNIEWQEMYRVFNMGIGMTLVCSPEDSPHLLLALPEARVIGKVAAVRGRRKVTIA